MTLDQPSLRLFALASLGALLIACNSTTLQPIDEPSTGGGGTGTGDEAGGSGGAETGEQAEPMLVVAHEFGMYIHRDFQSTFKQGVVDNYGDFEGLVRDVEKHGDDLVVVSDVAVGEVTLRRYANLVSVPDAEAFVETTLTLPGVGSSTQMAGPLFSDAVGGLWMLTGSVTLGTATPANTLRWSPQGDIDGPWVVHDASPTINTWALLADQSTIVAGTNDGLVLLSVDRDAETITTIDGGPQISANYTAMQIHDGVLYAVTPDCLLDIQCYGFGELHVWSDTNDAFDLPNVVVPFPSTTSVPCSLTVNDNALVVGACSSPTAIPPEQRLWVYEPDALTAGTMPAQVVVLSRDPLELESIHWLDDPYENRSFSVVMRSGTDPDIGDVFDDRMGEPLADQGGFSTEGPITDLLFAD